MESNERLNVSANQTRALYLPQASLSEWSRDLEMVRVAELVDQPLTSLRLLHDPLLVVLSQRPGKLVIVHRWSVLSLSPQGCHLDRVNDLEDALLPVDPVDVVAVESGLQ